MNVAGYYGIMLAICPSVIVVRLSVRFFVYGQLNGNVFSPNSVCVLIL